MKSINKLSLINILLIFTLSITSCSGTNVTSKMSAISGTLQTLDELDKKNKILESENRSLERIIQNYKDSMSSTINDPNNDPEEIQYQTIGKIEMKYPEIALIQTSFGQSVVKAGLKKIVIYKPLYNPTKKITFTDKKILDIFSSIRVTRVMSLERVSYRFDSFNYDFYYGDKIFTINVESDYIFSLSEYPGKYFMTADKISTLGLAFLDAPANYPENSTLAKMASSPIMTDKNGTVFKGDFPIPSIIYIFNEKNKKEIARPDVKNNELKENLTFYYFGTKMIMTFYDGYISITDGQVVKWYELDDESIDAIIYTLSVG
ncbi:MAG: hypothetical protein ACYCYI_06500 [Saccharofermentanales bacterium]